MVNFSHSMTVLAASIIAVTTAVPSHKKSEWCIPHTVSSGHQREIWNGFWHDFYITRNVSDTFHTYIVKDYVQHNPFEGQGAQASLTYLQPIFESPAIGVKVLRQGFDNGLGWIHTRIDGYAPLPVAIVDIFRFNGSCVQEHWDVIEELPSNATNPIALF